MSKLIAQIGNQRMKRVALVLLFIPCLLGSCMTTRSISNTKCTVHQIEMIVLDATAYAGNIFCGEVYAVEYGATARILSSPNEMPPTNDVALLVSSQTRRLLAGLSEVPQRFYLEARIDPMMECFSPSGSGEDCSPYRRPIVFHILSAQRRH